MSGDEMRGGSRSCGFFRYINGIRLAVVVSLALLFLCGCGTKKLDVSTEMAIEQDGSGYRQIRIEFKKEDYQRLFPGISWENTLEIITEKCPKEFGFSHSDMEESYQYTFQMDFESIEDYQKKVQNIVGDAGIVRYEQPHSVFASGMYFEENFTSLAFLNWLYELVEEKGKLAAGTGESLFKVGNVVLIDNGQRVILGSEPIRYDMRVVNPVEQIDVLTHYLENKRCDRQVIIKFEQKAAEKNRAQLESWFTRQLPQGVTGNWQGEGAPVFIISGSNMVDTEVDVLMQSVLSKRDSFVSVNSQPKSKLFDSAFNWVERINLNALTDSDSENIKLGYYVQGGDGMKITVKYQNEDKAIKLENSAEYQGYKKVLESELREVNLETSVTASYVVSRVEMETRLEEKKRISRDIDLFFQIEPDEKDIEHILSKLTKICEGYANVSRKINEDGSFIAIRIAQTGTIDFINEGFTEIFGVKGQMQYDIKGKLLELRHNGTFSDTVDFTKFIENDFAKTQLIYRLIYPSRSRIEGSVTSNVAVGKDSAVKNEYQAVVDTGTYFYLTMNCSIPNKTGRLILGSLLAAIILIPILLLVIRAIRRMTRRTVGKLTSAFRKFNNSFGPDDQPVLGYEEMQQSGTEKPKSPRAESDQAGMNRPYRKETDQTGMGKEKTSGKEAEQTNEKAGRKKTNRKKWLNLSFRKKKAPDVAYEEQQFEADTPQTGEGKTDMDGSIYQDAKIPEAEGFSEVHPQPEDTEDGIVGYESFDSWTAKGKEGKAGNVYDMNYNSAPWRGKNSPLETFDGSINDAVDTSDDDL